jgi:hypothetical protein
MLQSYWESAPPEERNEIVRASFAAALLAVLFLVFAFAPARDPSQVVGGIPCSIFSERQIGAVFGATMRLRPTDGTVCQYVSINPDMQGMLFVIARHDGTQGSLGRVLDHKLNLRYEGRIYTLIAVAGAAHANVAEGQERRLALMLDHRVAKRNSATH